MDLFLKIYICLRNKKIIWVILCHSTNLKQNIALIYFQIFCIKKRFKNFCFIQKCAKGFFHSYVLYIQSVSQMGHPVLWKVSPFNSIMFRIYIGNPYIQMLSLPPILDPRTFQQCTGIIFIMLSRTR